MNQASPLLPLGEDCECGHPLVMRHGETWCSVYGNHRTPVIVQPRASDDFNRHAPFAGLVLELAAMEMPVGLRRQRIYRVTAA